MTFGGYPVNISESSIQLGLKVLQKMTDYECENIELRYKKATKAAELDQIIQIIWYSNS